NWGVSYLVNDFYRRFLAAGKHEAHYVRIGRIFTVVLILLSGYVAAQLTSIRQGWQIVLNLGMGTGAVYILRWYWWRVNAWSEIRAMGAAASITLVLSRIQFAGNDAVLFAKTSLITAAGTTACWLIATFLTRPEPESTLVAFYRRIHPSIYGWRRIAEKVPELLPVRDLADNALDWVLGSAFVYAALFGIGKLIFGELQIGLPLLLVAITSAYLLFRHLSKRGWHTLSGTESGDQDTVDVEAVVDGAL